MVDGAAFVVDGDARVHPVDADTTDAVRGGVSLRARSSNRRWTARCRSPSCTNGSISSRRSGSSWWRCGSTAPSATSACAASPVSSRRTRRSPRSPRTSASGSCPRRRARWWGSGSPTQRRGSRSPGSTCTSSSADRSTGGHVLDLTVDAARIQIDGADEVHVELPPHVGLGRPGPPIVSPSPASRARATATDLRQATRLPSGDAQSVRRRALAISRAASRSDWRLARSWRLSTVDLPLPSAISTFTLPSEK